ncbi:putative short-chain dehydrogenases/reductase [Aspergillus stella-maris]|uniref:putative short-chain dehydrogenases/reductase n=1 Tax=Aspergillus stella-maris TaxID=1810926 RepID=UPI003CCDE30E
MSLLSFSCALVTGGGGGLGKAIAAYLLSKGKKVIIAGRTESNLRATAEEIGATDYFVLDTGVVDRIPDFIAKITAKYPDLDCLVNNAGVQRPLSVLNDEPSEFLAKADQEIDINVRGPMHLTLGLLKHFKSKPNGAVVMNVSSILAFVPLSVINPVYNGTKAWLHFWSMTLRTQLAHGGYEKIKVVEIAPPSVGTDLHRDREDPDDNKKHKNPNALTVDEFMESVSDGLENGDTIIAPGMSKEFVDLWYKDFGEAYERWTGVRNK